MLGHFYGIRDRKPRQKLIFNRLAGFFSVNNLLAFPSAMDVADQNDDETTIPNK